MKRILTAVATAAALLVPAGGASAQCTSTTFIEIPAGVATFYYDDASETPPVPGAVAGPGGTFIYVEADGEPGLQRGGGNVVERTTGVDLPAVLDDDCVEGSGDMLIGKSCARIPVFYGIEAPTCLS